MDLFYCGNQWGYLPSGSSLNIPADYCNVPTGLKTTVSNQFVTFSWLAPHDYLHFLLEYSVEGSGVWTPVEVYGQAITLALQGSTNYEWRVSTVCAVNRSSASVNGTVVITGITVNACTPVAEVVITGYPDYIKASWATTGAIYYKVYLTVNGNTTVFDTPYLEFKFYNTIVGALYEVYVVAVCASNVANPSPTVTFVGGTVECNKVTSINYVRGETSIIVSWQHIMGTTYNVYLDGVLQMTAYPLTTFEFKNLTSDILYTIVIIRNCTSGYSYPATLQVKTLKAVCANPTAANITGITNTGFTVNWTPAPGVDSQGIVLNNGSLIPLGAAIATYAFADLPSGSLNNVKIYSVCNGLLSQGISVQQQLTGCAAVTNITVNVISVGNAVVSWDTVSNAWGYRLVVTRTSDMVIVHESVVTANSVNLNILAAVTEYSFAVLAYCGVNGNENTPSDLEDLLFTTPVAQACEQASGYTIESQTQTETTLSFEFASGINGPIIVRVIGTGYDEQFDLDYNNGSITFVGLTPGAAYNVSIYKPANNCTPPVTFVLTQPALCAVPTAITADVVIENGIQYVTIAGTPDAGAISHGYRISADGETWGDIVEFAGFPLELELDPGQYYIDIRTNCSLTSFSEWESLSICPEPITATFAVVNNTITILWDPVVNTDNASIELTSLVDGSKTYSSPDNFITISDLSPNTSYTGKVSIPCFGGLIESNEFAFITGAAGSNELCGFAEFTADIQDQDVTDPIGGGSTSDCTVVGDDWEVQSFAFVPTSGDPSFDTYTEVIFVSNHAVAMGEISLIPGGICGHIPSGTCVPENTINLEMEILLGGTIIEGTGTAILTDSGTFTISGSYTSDGEAFLVIRVRGHFKRA